MNFQCVSILIFLFCIQFWWTVAFQATLPKISINRFSFEFFPLLSPLSIKSILWLCVGQVSNCRSKRSEKLYQWIWLVIYFCSILSRKILVYLKEDILKCILLFVLHFFSLSSVFICFCRFVSICVYQGKRYITVIMKKINV